MKKHVRSIKSIMYATLSSILLIIILLPSIFPVIALEEYTPGSKNSHVPISITGDSDFVTENGVISGSGSESDPFLIENWLIYGESNPGIYIGGTTSYFVIKNCIIIGGSSGIYLEAGNGIIENNVIVGDNNWGIGYYENIYKGVTIFADSCTIRNNMVLNTIVGLEIDGTNNLVYSNEFVNHNISAIVSPGNNVLWDFDNVGNYWSDYDGVDLNMDGIGDTPYSIDGSNRDNFPLMDMSIPDLDNDGIYNDVDGQPLVYSRWFSDYLKNGETQGEIMYGNNQYLTIKDEPSPYGIRAIADPDIGDNLAWLSTLKGNYTLEGGTDLILTYGSEHVKVNEGPALADFFLFDKSKLEIALVTGDEIIFDPLTYELYNIGQNSVVAFAFGQEFLVEPTSTFRFNLLVNFKPDTLNLLSNGKWITTEIESSNIYDVNDIDFDSINLKANGALLYPDPNDVPSFGDFDNDGVMELKIKFLRNELVSSFDTIDYQSESGRINEVILSISGTYTDGLLFSCSNTIKVLIPR